MKKISFVALLIMLPNIVFADVTKNSTPFTWALAAVGDTIDMYYRDYRYLNDSELTLRMLVKMGDKIKANPTRTPKELVDSCVKDHEAISQVGLKCNKKSGCNRYG